MNGGFSCRIVVSDATPAQLVFWSFRISAPLYIRNMFTRVTVEFDISCYLNSPMMPEFIICRPWQNTKSYGNNFCCFYNLTYWGIGMLIWVGSSIAKYKGGFITPILHVHKLHVPYISQSDYIDNTAMGRCHIVCPFQLHILFSCRYVERLDG